MPNLLVLSVDEAEALLTGMKRGKRLRYLEHSYEEEVILLREALALNRFEEVPEKNIKTEYEDKRMTELRKLQKMLLACHDPGGTREEIEAGK